MFINGVRHANTTRWLFEIKALRTRLINNVNIKMGMRNYIDFAPNGANTESTGIGVVEMFE